MRIIAITATLLAVSALSACSGKNCEQTYESQVRGVNHTTQDQTLELEVYAIEAQKNVLKTFSFPASKETIVTVDSYTSTERPRTAKADFFDRRDAECTEEPKRGFSASVQLADPDTAVVKLCFGHSGDMHIVDKAAECPDDTNELQRF